MPVAPPKLIESRSFEITTWQKVKKMPKYWLKLSRIRIEEYVYNHIDPYIQ